MIRFFISLYCILFFATSLECSIVPFGPHRLSGFVETGIFKRKREGGSHQDGALFGIGGDYESLKENGLYFFGRAYKVKGKLKGSAGESTLKSHFDSEDSYGRTGYSICLHRLIVAPYVGGGYTRMNNDFIEPSPQIVSMRISYPYALAGLKFEWRSSDEVQFFTSFQMKKPYEPKCVIKDPEFFTMHQTITEKLQADFEIGARLNLICFPISAGFEGSFFYQYNHFGKHENFPFNFQDTKHRYYGLRLAITAVF